MKNFIVTYDLNGPVPSHAQMDFHLRNSGAAAVGRILETVWYIQIESTLERVYGYVNRICTSNDRVLVIEAEDMCMRNLLISTAAIQSVWPLAA